VVVRQQREIAEFTRQIETLKTQLRAVATASETDRTDETPPPHY
jgi:uncharacterized coiled-coil protein SlyX